MDQLSPVSAAVAGWYRWGMGEQQIAIGRALARSRQLSILGDAGAAKRAWGEPSSEVVVLSDTLDVAADDSID